MTKREQKIFEAYYMAALEKALDTDAEEDFKIAKTIKKLKEEILAAAKTAWNADGE